MRVWVVYEIKDNGDGYISGVFSDNQQAIDYCDRVDPKDETHYADEYTVDELVKKDTP